MLPTPQSYMLFPSVVPADKLTAMTVCATEPAFIFTDGNKYTINIISVNADENYYAPHTHKKLDVTVDGGALRFDFAFEGEQEHTIQLIKDGAVIQYFAVFSLHEDLYSLTPLKGDLHSHSCRSDGSRDPSSQAGHYREQGFDFAALTDHNRYFTGEEIDTTFDGINTGFVRVLGEEVHCPGSVVHIVHIGGRQSVAEIYIHHRKEYEAEVEKYQNKVPTHIPEQYKDRYAKAMWATDKIHAFGGLAIFPHPFWRPGASKTYNVCDEFAKLLLNSGIFDAYELIGGMTQPDLNRSVAFWNDLRAEGLKISIVGSSDVHSLERSPHFPGNFTICFAEKKTNDAIVKAIKNGFCVAGETTGYEYDTQYRCYGSTRLVTYSQFLLKNYFPKLARLTAGAGVAMRAYVMEDTDAALINMHTDLADRFTARFFGRLAPTLPSKKLLDFEASARDNQLARGPLTRGSSVDATPAKSLI